MKQCLVLDGGLLLQEFPVRVKLTTVSDLRKELLV